MKQQLFNVIVIYYFIFINIIKDNIIPFSSLKWFFLVFPISIFVLFNIDTIINGKYRYYNLLFLLYIFFAAIISFFRLDIDALFNILIWGLPFIIILNSKIYLDLKLLNILFIISIILSIISYYLGNNDYGFILGQAYRKDLWWRVTLGNGLGLAVSAIFSLLVIIMNFYYNKSRKQKIFYIIFGLYFLIFSGVRTGIICFLIILSVVLFSYLKKIKPCKFYKILPIIIIFVFIISVINPVFLFKDLDIKNKFINSYVFRKESISNLSKEEFIKAFARPIIWSQHYEILLNSPLIGVGSFSMYDYFTEPVSSGSESMLTNFIVRDGLLSSSLLIIFLYLLIINALKEKKVEKYSFYISFVLILISYGSFCHTYNFLFLMMIAFYNSSYIYNN